jgi:hypothetical protein
MNDRQTNDGIHRKYLRLTDGGTLCVVEILTILWYSCWICRGIDFTPFDQSKVPGDAPIVVVQSGLTGGMLV